MPPPPLPLHFNYWQSGHGLWCHGSTPAMVLQAFPEAFPEDHHKSVFRAKTSFFLHSMVNATDHNETAMAAKEMIKKLTYQLTKWLDIWWFIRANVMCVHQSLPHLLGAQERTLSRCLTGLCTWLVQISSLVFTFQSILKGYGLLFAV